MEWRETTRASVAVAVCVGMARKTDRMRALERPAGKIADRLNRFMVVDCLIVGQKTGPKNR